MFHHAIITYSTKNPEHALAAQGYDMTSHFALPLMLSAKIEGDHHERDIIHGIGVARAGDGKVRPHGQYDDGHDSLDLDKICDIFDHKILLIRLRWAATPAVP